jgi:hypothetical protein
MSWLLSLGCGGLAVLVAIFSAVARGARPPGWARTPRGAMLGGIVLLIVGLCVMSSLPAGTGAKGCAAAFSLAVMLAPLACLVSALSAQASEVVAASDTYPSRASASFSFLPGVFLLSAGMAALGLVHHHYGIHAQPQMQCFVAGLGLGLGWTAVVLRSAAAWAFAEGASSLLVESGITLMAIVWTICMASYHFPATSNAPWFPIFCGVGSVGGWTMSLVAAAAFAKGRGGSAATLVCALIMALALGCAAYSAQKNVVGVNEDLLPALAAGFLAALLVLLAASSGKSAEEQSPHGDIDALACVLVVLMAVGVAWVGFKLWLGLGMVVCALGFLAALPAAVALGNTQPLSYGLPLAERSLTLVGSFLLLLGGMKVFQQAGDMSLTGIDISDGNVTVALMAGAILPVIWESLMGRRSAEELTSSHQGAVVWLVALVRAAMLTVLGMGTVLAFGLYFGVEGVAVGILGLALWSLLAGVGVTAGSEEHGLVSFRSLPYAPVFVATAVVLLPWREHLLDVTRQQKMQLLVALVILTAVSLSAVTALRRKKGAAAGSATEGSSQSIQSQPAATAAQAADGATGRDAAVATAATAPAAASGGETSATPPASMVPPAESLEQK